MVDIGNLAQLLHALHYFRALLHGASHFNHRQLLVELHFDRLDLCFRSVNATDRLPTANHLLCENDARLLLSLLRLLLQLCLRFLFGSLNVCSVKYTNVKNPYKYSNLQALLKYKA